MAKKKTINLVKSQVIYKDYSKDAERTALISGENLAHMFGKIARWYTDISWVGHTHTEANITDFGTYAGSSTKGGAATSANKLNIGASDIGSETKPVYFNATTGKPVACAYSLNASVPANAVFTDINVKQSPSTANESREVLFAGNTGNTETTGTVGKSNKLYFNPNTGALTATSFSGSVDASNLTGSIDAGRLPTTSVTAGSYGPAAGGTLAHGGTFNVGYVTVDKYGRLTGASTKTFTLPAQYVHPTYTSKTSGLYKITVDSTGHVSGTAAVTASDLPAHTHSASDMTSGTLANLRLPARLQEYQTTALISFDTTITGFYYSGNDSSSPFKSLHSDYLDYMLLVQGYNSGWAAQLATDYRSNNMALRIKNSNTWTNWSMLLTNSNYSSYITPAGIGALSTSTKYALSGTVGGPAISATAIKLTHGNEINFSKLTGGYKDIYFGWRWREADGTETSELSSALNCYHFLRGDGSTYAAIKASEFQGPSTSSYKLWNDEITIQTGSSKQAHISMSTLVTWLVSQGYITNNTTITKVLLVSWAYANNDILQVSIDGTNYEIQLAGAVIEFHGYVNTSTSYTTGIYRFIIHTAPTKSFTPASGYTQFPVSHIAEFFCNGADYTPTWKMISYSDHTHKYALSDTVGGTAISSYSNHLKFGNEMNISKLNATGHVWFGYRWDTNGTTENGKDINLYITKYIFGNCAGDGSKAQIEASEFIGNATSATTASKLSTNAGSNVCPVYFSGGIPVACKQAASGAYFSIVPFVRSDGVMDIGRYIDFHTTNASTSVGYRINQWTTDSIEFDSRGTNNRVNIYAAGEGYAQLSFQLNATDKAYTASGIRVRPLTASGTVMQIECSGNMVIGSGESPSTLYSNSYDNLDTSETERLYLASDNEIYFITNAQTYAGVKRLIIDKSGNLKIQQAQHVVQLQNSSGNYTSAIKWWSGGTDPGNYGPEIGQHNIGDTDGSICILPYNTTTSPWGGSVGLFISKTRLLYNGTAISLNGHTHTYLIDPGNSSYKIELAWSGASVPATDTTTYPAVFTKYNLTSGISVRIKESTWDAYKTFLGLGSAAYTASTAYATASHNHDSLYVAKSMIDISTTTSLGLDGGKNAFGYVSGLTKATWNNNQTDGAIIRQFYNASWKAELFIDYRSGQTSVRGKNNGTFTDWGSFAILKSDGSYWGMCSPSGANNVWIRTTTLGIIPYQSGAAGSGHCGLGTSSWYFSYAYIDDIHGTLYGNASTASEVGTVVTDPSSNTAYGITFVVDPGTSENNTIRKTNCFRLNHSVGAANTEGITEIVLGNSAAKTAANNSSGQIAFYNSNGKYSVIKPNTNSSNVTLYLPSSGGTLALVGDNNHTHSQYLSSSTIYAKGVTQNGDAVTAQSLRVTHNNEINASKPGDYTYIWFFYRWNDGGTEDTSGSKYISTIYFGNGNGAGTNTSVGRFADLQFKNITGGTMRHTGDICQWWADRDKAMVYQSYGDSNYRPTWGTATKDDGSWCCGNYNNNNLTFNYIPYSVYNSGQNPTLYKQIIFTDDAKIEARGYNVINNGSGRLIMDYSGIELTNSKTGTWAAGIDMKNASGTLLSAIGFYGSDTALTYTYLGGAYNDPIIKLESSGYATFKDGMKVNNNISLQETKNIILRPNHSSYTAGIGYDTSGNECIAIWAKNTVTRLRWYAGTDMSTMTSGTMMGITPDFEISKASGTTKGYIAGDSIVTHKILWSGSTSCTARSSTDITLTTAISANKYRFIKIVWTVSGGTGVSEIRADTLNIINNVSSASGATTANIIQFTISSDGKKLTVGPGTTAITVLQIAGVCVI